MGKASDLIRIAHELAHAVQIVVSRENQQKKDRFMPPMARECCAFLGEIALIDYLEHRDVEVYKLLKKVWANDNLKYLSADVVTFKQALGNTSLKYSYCWNYPIARLYAMMLRRQSTKLKSTKRCSAIGRFFSSGHKAIFLISIKILIESLPIINPLPAISVLKNDDITTYKKLGIIITLYFSASSILNP